MMLLCIEVSAEPGVIGLMRHSEILFEQAIANRNDFGKAVDGLFQLASSALPDLSAVVIGNGPGSFTGLRVGLAFAKGIALSRNLPIWPLASHQIYAANIAGSRKIAVISHARRGQVHLSFWSADSALELEQRVVVPVEELPDRVPADFVLTGPALVTLPDAQRTHFSQQLVIDENLLQPQVSRMSELAIRIWKDREAPNVYRLLPDYGLDFS